MGNGFENLVAPVCSLNDGLLSFLPETPDEHLDQGFVIRRLLEERDAHYVDVVENLKQHPDALIFVSGPMFSGKTDFLIGLYEACLNAQVGINAGFIRSSINTREPGAKSRSKKEVCECPDFESLSDEELVAYDIAFFDEAQFMEKERLLRIIEARRLAGKPTVIGLLDKKFDDTEWDVYVGLHGLVQGKHVVEIKCHALCANCGGVANKSHRTSGGTEAVQIGDAEYKALCPCCYARETGTAYNP